MKFLVTSYSDPNDTRVIEGSGFRVDEGGAILIVNKEELVARLVNVNIEAIPSGRESSKALVKLAQRYRNFSEEDLVSVFASEEPQVTKDSKALATDIRSLAGSVLSQAGKD